jgi:hypothetical protein
VFNVSMGLMKELFPSRPFRVVEVEMRDQDKDAPGTPSVAVHAAAIEQERSR